jgi:hypothetical protein
MVDRTAKAIGCLVVIGFALAIGYVYVYLIGAVVRGGVAQ